MTGFAPFAEGLFSLGFLEKVFGSCNRTPFRIAI